LAGTGTEDAVTWAKTWAPARPESPTIVMTSQPASRNADVNAPAYAVADGSSSGTY
jgi:hypothetical protein